MQVTTLQGLSDNLQQGKPLICFDFGARKIGVSLSTPDLSMCMPHSIINERDAKKQIIKCAELAANTSACAIVVGLPLHMDGSRSEQSELAEKFASKLSAKSQLPVYLQDERLTSKTADNLLKSTGMSRKSRNSNDDAIAANLILETTMKLLQTLPPTTNIQEK